MNKANGKVLICVPGLSQAGGVAQHNRTIRDFMPANHRFFERSQGKTLPGKVLAACFDLLRYILLLTFGNFKVVCLNPSLAPAAVKRDAVYAFIAKKIFRKKLVIFWHGWDPEFEVKLAAEKLAWFRKKYFCADKMLVLLSTAGTSLKSWGYNGRIEQVTTCFEQCFDALEKSFDFTKSYKVLFLARAEKAKGLMLAVEIAKYLAENCPLPIELTIAGDGSALHEAEKFVQDHQLKNVVFTGFITGKTKLDILQSSHIFLQCSYHEGLPCSLLEAMACSMPIVSSSVGGIPDFFEENKMGFLLNSMEPAAYAGKIIELVKNAEDIERMGRYNCQYARAHFTARCAAACLCAEIQSA